MRIQDLISDFLSLIDGAQQEQPAIVFAQPEEAEQEDASPLTYAGDDIRRFRQIVDLANSNPTTFDNSPDEQYADIDSVTINAGGGINNPKHPHDIRVKDPSAYPNQQEF